MNFLEGQLQTATDRDSIRKRNPKHERNPMVVRVSVVFSPCIDGLAFEIGNWVGYLLMT